MKTLGIIALATVWAGYASAQSACDPPHTFCRGSQTATASDDQYRNALLHAGARLSDKQSQNSGHRTEH